MVHKNSIVENYWKPLGFFLIGTKRYIFCLSSFVRFINKLDILIDIRSVVFSLLQTNIFYIDCASSSYIYLIMLDKILIFSITHEDSWWNVTLIYERLCMYILSSLIFKLMFV